MDDTNTGSGASADRPADPPATATERADRTQPDQGAADAARTDRNDSGRNDSGRNDSGRNDSGRNGAQNGQNGRNGGQRRRRRGSRGGQGRKNAPDRESNGEAASSDADDRAPDELPEPISEGRVKDPAVAERALVTNEERKGAPFTPAVPPPGPAVRKDGDSGDDDATRTGAGGNNGVQSVIRSLGSQEFWRLKCGVGRPPGRQNPADFVLRPFASHEQPDVDLMIQLAADVVEVFLAEGGDAARQKAGELNA